MYADNEEANHVVKTLARVPDGRKVGFRIKRSEAETSKGNWSIELHRSLVDDRPIIKVEDKDPLPPFDQLKPAIYKLTHERVFNLYDHYTSTVGRIPDRRMVRYDG
eukprot:155040-Pleurochrysis_carterae.AAC.1